MNFIKKFFSIIGVNILMCLLPLLFSGLLSGDPRYTVNAGKSAGQIAVYVIYAILFVVVYFMCGRKSAEKRSGVAAAVVCGTLFAAIGCLVSYFVLVMSSDNIPFLILAMPQLMFIKAFGEGLIGNNVLSYILMFSPLAFILAGIISKGKLIKRFKRSEKA